MNKHVILFFSTAISDCYRRDKIHIQLLLLSTKDKRVGAVESLLFHGTRRTCLLGEDDGQISICSSPQCSLCRIIESSFDVARCGSHHKFSRWSTTFLRSAMTNGERIDLGKQYILHPVHLVGFHLRFQTHLTALTNGSLVEADDYSSSTHPEAKSRILLLNRVLAGREFVTRENSTKLIKPPDGYHSVRFSLIFSIRQRDTHLLSWRSQGSPAYIWIMKRPSFTTTMPFVQPTSLFMFTSGQYHLKRGSVDFCRYP